MIPKWQVFMFDEIKVITMLNEQGYLDDYRLGRAGLICLRTKEIFNFDAFLIDELYQFTCGFLQGEHLDICALTNIETNSKGILITFYRRDLKSSTREWFRDLIGN